MELKDSHVRMLSFLGGIDMLQFMTRPEGAHTKSVGYSNIQSHTAATRITLLAASIGVAQSRILKVKEAQLALVSTSIWSAPLWPTN